MGSGNVWGTDCQAVLTLREQENIHLVAGYGTATLPLLFLAGFLNRFMSSGKKKNIYPCLAFLKYGFCYNDYAAMILHNQVLNKCVFTKLLGISTALAVNVFRHSV